MKWNEWLENWSMTGLKIKIPFAEMEWNPKDKDKDAAWELYIELLTRIATQELIIETGDEETALESIHKLFELTRITIKNNGRQCIEFTKIAIIVLNQIVRPFTSKWHRLNLQGSLKNDAKCTEFRNELKQLQDRLIIYTGMLADMAGVEDLTQLEDGI